MKKVLILLSNGFEVYEAGAFIDILGWATVFGSDPIEIVTAGVSERLHCTFGFDVIPDALISQLDLNSFDALAIPGGFESAGFYNDAYAPMFIEVIKQFERLFRRFYRIHKAKQDKHRQETSSSFR